ncbi:MAG TPA: glycosyltransferase family 39 protein, partial [Urbifossiella sp.]
MIGIAYLAIAAAIGLHRVEETGPIWPDSPRYANAGILVRDWVLSDQWLRPIPFAIDRYAHSPGFSAPYHPPGFPAALGGWFLITGISHESARLFIALSWGFAAWLFYGINRELLFNKAASFAAGLLLLTMPQIAIWSRDTMSEIPSLVPLFVATLFWLRWLRTSRPIDGLLALGFAIAAFFFRVTTAGILPGLVVFGACVGGWNRRHYLLVAAGSCIYLALAAGWVAFASRYSTHEISADGKGTVSLAAAIAYFELCLPQALMSGTAALAALGLIRGIWSRENPPAIGFWLAWLASYTAFKIAVPSSLEQRHFLTALPALAGLSAAIFPLGAGRGKCLAWLVAIAAIGVNVWLLADCPRGVVGYQGVAELLARSDRPGNVLLASWEDQDLLFRSRAAAPARDRFFIRSDRTLAVRVSSYAKVAAKILATNEEDVLELIHKGRIRFIVISSARPDQPDLRPEEMRLVERTMEAHPDLFRRIGEF